MDGSRHYPHAPLEQTASGGIGVMEFRDGVSALLCSDCREPVLSGGLGAEGQHGTATVTGVVLRSASEAWEATSRASGGELFCAIGGLGAELVGGAATGLGCGCDDLGPTLCGLGGEHTVSGLCHSRGVDRSTSDGETCVAERMAAD